MELPENKKEDLIVLAKEFEESKGEERVEKFDEFRNLVATLKTRYPNSKELDFVENELEFSNPYLKRPYTGKGTPKKTVEQSFETNFSEEGKFLIFILIIISLAGLVTLSYFASIEKENETKIGLIVGACFFAVILLATITYFFIKLLH